MPIRAVIFDFNGVLVDDEDVHFRLFREVLQSEGLDMTEAQYHDIYLGYDDRGVFELAMSRAGRPFDTAFIDSLIARKADRYLAVAAEGLRFFPGAAETVAKAAERWPLAICSGALRPEIEFSLDTMGVRNRIVAIVAAEDTTRGKPDPEGYRLAGAALREQALPDLDPADCLVIEDSLAGIEAARAAGMQAMGVPNTYTPEELLAAGASRVLDGLGELLSLPV